MYATYTWIGVITSIALSIPLHAYKEPRHEFNLKQSSKSSDVNGLKGVFTLHLPLAAYFIASWWTFITDVLCATIRIKRISFISPSKGKFCFKSFLQKIKNKSENNIYKHEFRPRWLFITPELSKRLRQQNSMAALSPPDILLSLTSMGGGGTESQKYSFFPLKPNQMDRRWLPGFVYSFSDLL